MDEQRSWGTFVLEKASKGKMMNGISERFAKVWGNLKTQTSNLIDAASGYDREILAAFGSDLCKTKARAIGAVVVASSAVGALGTFLKVFAIVPGVLAIPVAVVGGAIYATITYNLERILAGGLSPYMSVKERATVIISRGTVALVWATFQAVPWILLSLSTPIQTKLTALAFDEQAALRAKVDAALGTTNLAGKTTSLTKEVRDLDDAIKVLPEPVIDIRQAADSCKTEFEKLAGSNRRKINTLNGYLPAIANIEMSPNATALSKDQAVHRRMVINTQVEKLQAEIDTKRNECLRLNAQAIEAKNRYLTEATAKRDAAAKGLELHKVEVAAVEAKQKSAYEHVEQTVKRGFVTQSGAEIKAAIELMRDELFAKIIALGIFLGFYIIDLAPIGLKLFLKAGPYDDQKRALDISRKDDIEHRLKTEKMRRDTEFVVDHARSVGVQQFHREDAGGVFARQERAKHEEDAMAAEESRDLRIAKLRLMELKQLIDRLAEIKDDVSSNPALAAKLHDILVGLRAAATPAAA